MDSHYRKSRHRMSEDDYETHENHYNHREEDGPRVSHSHSRRHRDRERERSAEKDRSRDKHRDGRCRERSPERKHEHGEGRDREFYSSSRDRNRDYRERSLERDKNTERSSERSRKRPYDEESIKDSYMNSHRSGREREKSAERSKRRRIEGDKERDVDPSRDRESKERSRETSRNLKSEDRKSIGTEHNEKVERIEQAKVRDAKQKDRRYLEDQREPSEEKVFNERTFEEEKAHEKRKFEDFKTDTFEASDIAKKQRVDVDSEAPASKEHQDSVPLHSTGVEQCYVVESKGSSKDSPKSPTISLENPSIAKVSRVLTTNVVENKADNIVRSDEITGKPSTDGNSLSSTKGANLSLDALTKAKLALQKQKEVAAKLMKLPQISKLGGSSSVAASTAQSTQITSTSSTKLSVSSAASTVSKPLTSAASTVSKPITSMSSESSILQSVTKMPGMTGVTNIMPGHANYEAVKRAQELAAKLGFRQDPEFMPLLSSMIPGQSSDATVPAQQKPSKAPVLRLDAQGREIDEHGNVIDKPKITNLSTLKVNINKQKKEAFQILRPEFEEDPSLNPHFDPEMGVNKTKLTRPKRMSFQFVEEGKWSKQAEVLKFKSQFGEAQAKELKIKQAQLAKAKAELEDINPNLIEVSERIPKKEEKIKDPIPDVEWWDVNILPSGNYSDVAEGDVKLKMEKITIYVEHPQPIEPPAEPAPPPPQPLKLTKKEQKKLRTQRRLAKEKDRQEMIRQGLLEPPKPKVKMSNLMKVLGTQATQDPTKLEMEIHKAAAEREQAHVDRNIARKLTPAERREKKEKKLFDDPSTLETIVSVYKINDLSHPQTRFKVDVNAQENRLTGCAVMSDSMTVVVVEGCSKSIKRYRKLMLQRINWAAAVVKDGEAEDDDEDEDKPANKCVLVWQGSVAKPSFHKFIIQQCRTDAAARKFFADAGVAHYWDLASNITDDQIL